VLLVERNHRNLRNPPTSGPDEEPIPYRPGPGVLLGHDAPKQIGFQDTYDVGTPIKNVGAVNGSQPLNRTDVLSGRGIGSADNGKPVVQSSALSSSEKTDDILDKIYTELKGQTGEIKKGGSKRVKIVPKVVRKVRRRIKRTNRIKNLMQAVCFPKTLLN
jgi:hypothetical protein